MAIIDIPAAKRAGLPVDLERLARLGDGALTPEERYALKTHGVCAQRQDHVFMVRVRIAGGRLLAQQGRALAELARRHGRDWIHLTTRQNIELHWVADRSVPALLDDIEATGLTTRAACGHTLRNVMCSDEAGVGLDEPFDCLPDARAVSNAIVARSQELNCVLPSRLNLAFGGAPRCRHDALLNDGAFVSVVRDGRLGYEVWGGGSLGKSPRLAIQLASFIGRQDVLAAAEALIEVFVEHGDFDHPSKGRMKFVVERMGEDAFRAAWVQAFESARRRPHLALEAMPVPDEADTAAILASAPRGGWSAGIRPQRAAGRALVTVDIPMGDVDGHTLATLADLADEYGDGTLRLTRDQDVLLRDVPVESIDRLRAELAQLDLRILGENVAPRVRACTGAAVCSLGITTAPDAGIALLGSAGLRRNPALRVWVSGCPNSCAQHQAADIGLSGAKVRIDGAVVDGYQIFTGADLDRVVFGEVVGRVAAGDAVAAVDALVGLWESLRHDGETCGRTFRRVGLDAIAAHVATVLQRRWASGPQEDELVHSANPAA